MPRDPQIALRDAEQLARGRADHRLHDVDAGDRLGDRVLDLHARVHLEEVEVIVAVDQELAGAGAHVVHGASRRDRRSAHPLAQLVRDAVARRLLDHLLVTALDRALALEQVHDVAVPVREHLDLDVARLLDELLDVEPVVAEGGACLAARPRDGLRDLALACAPAACPCRRRRRSP